MVPPHNSVWRAPEGRAPRTRKGAGAHVQEKEDPPFASKRDVLACARAMRERGLTFDVNLLDLGHGFRARAVDARLAHLRGALRDRRPAAPQRARCVVSAHPLEQLRHDFLLGGHDRPPFRRRGRRDGGAPTAMAIVGGAVPGARSGGAR